MAEQLGARLLAEVEADTLDEVRSSSATSRKQTDNHPELHQVDWESPAWMICGIGTAALKYRFSAATALSSITSSLSPFLPRGMGRSWW